MCNILNALKIGSWEIPWTMEEALFWNLIAQVCLLLAVVIVFIIVIRRVLKDVAPQKIEFPKEERTLMGITLDASMVQRDFKVGDEFACDGLLVIANYNLAPASEVVGEFTVISQEMLKNEEALEALTECLVVAPDMTEPGKKTVNVSYRGQSTSFIISVTEVEEAEPVPKRPKSPRNPPRRRLRSPQGPSPSSPRPRPSSARWWASAWTLPSSAATSMWATSSSAKASSSWRTSTPRRTRCRRASSRSRRPT